MSKSKRVRWPFFIVAVAGGAISAVGACSFPDVSFGDADGSMVSPDATADGLSPTSDSSSDAEIDSGKPFDPNVDPEGGSKDASSAGDAAIAIDAAGCAATCDCDTDSFNRLDAPMCDGGPGPTDCDDTVRAIHPDTSGTFYTDPWPNGKYKTVGDWDCSGTTTLQYSHGIGTCPLLPLGCAQAGFVANPACGETADYVTCSVSGGLIPSCVSAIEKRTQGCH